MGLKTTMINAAFYNCQNIAYNAYFYSSNITGILNCFGLKNNSRKLRIYYPANSITNTTLHCNNTLSLVGANITWTQLATYSYNTAYNIYLYPVDDVANKKAQNES